MSRQATLPPARERNRYGIRPFNPENAAAANDALFDRVVLKVQGRVTPMWPDAVAEFASGVGTNSASPLFERVRGWKDRRVSKLRTGTTISKAKLVVWDHGTFGSIDLELTVNPMRTLGHLLDRYSYEQIADLTPTEFFEKRRSPRAKSLTLDGNDNMVADFLAFSGTVHTARVQRVAEYLRSFEAHLIARIMEGLCPPELGYDLQLLGGNAVAENDHARVELEWSSLKVSQCEVCWEWHDPDALSKVHALADTAVTSARSTEVNFFDRPTVERTLGALAVRLPLPGDVVIVIYAKAQDRLRVEVRYPTGLAKTVGDRLPTGTRMLKDWLDVTSNHAAQRVPWESLHALLTVPSQPDLDALADLLAAVADATDRAKSKRQGLLRQLLRHGAVTGTSRDGPAPYQVLKKLADRGVVEHMRLARRDAEEGRRYRLADRYAGLIERLHGEAT